MVEKWRRKKRGSKSLVFNQDPRPSSLNLKYKTFVSSSNPQTNFEALKLNVFCSKSQFKLGANCLKHSLLQQKINRGSNAKVFFTF
jgi:hypothetical protein